MSERWANVLATIAAAAVIMSIAVFPVPLARGLWVWLWWGVFSEEETIFRLHGHKIPVEEMEEAAGEASIWFIVPYSRRWRGARNELVRNRIRGG